MLPVGYTVLRGGTVGLSLLISYYFYDELNSQTTIGDIQKKL